MKRFFRLLVLLPLLSVPSLSGGVDDKHCQAHQSITESRVDFGYAFATPHRMTVARPISSDKTLLDLETGSLKMIWTYENLLQTPLAVWMPPKRYFDVTLKPLMDGHPFAHSTWRRANGYLPVLDNFYPDPRGWMRLEVAGGESAAIVRLQVCNTSDRPHRFSLRCESRPRGFNPGWVDPDEMRDNLQVGQGDRADRVMVLGLGADEFSPSDGERSMFLTWNLEPGQTRTSWVIRPYKGYREELPALRHKDWAQEFEKAKSEWQTLLARACKLHIPDPGFERAFYACLSDIFIMSEPVADGYIATVPGTQLYRGSGNPFEGSVASVALDLAGLHQEAATTYRVVLDQQGADGDWADPKGWGNMMWSAPGFKAWEVMEHFRLTGDRNYLAKSYPRMVASSRFQEGQRARTRFMDDDDKRPLTFGLMPRGMGDGGLDDDGDNYGQYLPHNIWAVFADRISVEAAKILGKTSDLQELRGIYDRARQDLLQAMERGSIQEEGYRWIPAVPGKTTGSRWLVLNSFYPCGFLDATHELILGTIRKLESQMSPGGLPVSMGAMPDGIWVGVTVNDLGEAYIARGDGDAAVDLAYAALNHGTPMYTWCEERTTEPGSQKCVGDRQHLYTPAAMVSLIRKLMVMEDGDGLQLARGTSRQWLASGKQVGIADAPTYFGRVSYQMQYDAANGRLSAKVDFPEGSSLAWAILHVRLPSSLRVISLSPESGATILPSGRGIEWRAPRGTLRVEATIG
jgi:hypothetical protein